MKSVFAFAFVTTGFDRTEFDTTGSFCEEEPWEAFRRLEVTWTWSLMNLSICLLRNGPLLFGQNIASNRWRVCRTRHIFPSSGS